MHAVIFTSLGIMFYEMLASKKPYIGKDPADVVLKHVKAPVPQLPTQYAESQQLFAKMVAKAPDERFQSARQLVEHVMAEFGDVIDNQ